MMPLAIIEISCLVFVVISLVSQIAERNKSKTMYRIMLLSIYSFLWLLSDALAYLLNGSEGVPHYALYTLNLMSYVLSNVVYIGFLSYCDVYINEKVKLRRWVFNLPKLIMVTNIVIDIIYYHKGWLVKFEGNTFSAVGNPPAFTLISYIVLLFYPPIVALHFRKKVGFRAIMYLSIYIVPIVLSIIILETSGYDFSVVFGSIAVIIAVKFLQYNLKESKLAEVLAFTNFFLSTYQTAYYIGLEDLSCQIYKNCEELAGAGPVLENYLTVIVPLVKQTVHPDDRETMLSLVQPKSIKKIISQQSDFSYTFRDISGEEEKVIKLQIIRGADAYHAAIGFRDITREYHDQQEHLLGAVPISPDILTKADIGLWAFELDEGQPPRMYANDAMLSQIGLKKKLSPEEVYRGWHERIDESSINIVSEAIDRMMTDQSEVQYPWHHPNGQTLIFRYGGVRNKDYVKGIRIEGTHQNVTEMLHFDEEEIERLKKTENELRHEQLRREVLSYMVDHDDDPVELLKHYAENLRELINCDQIVYRDLEETRIMLNSPEIGDSWAVPIEMCRQCPHLDSHHPLYEDGYSEMEDCAKGWKGYPTHPECPIKSSLTRLVYCDGEVSGYLAIHYINEHHHFTDIERDTLEEFTRILSISLSRYEAKKENKELKLVREMQQQLTEALNMADSANRAKTEFLFNMSHDIRTPMNAILGYTDIALHHEEDADRVHDSLTKIKTSGGHLLSLINDILEMSRIEAGKLELVEVPIDIREAVESVNHMSQALAVRKAINFTTVLKDIRNPYVYADELHVNQILINLISNAVKYTDPGGDVKFTIEECSEPVNGATLFRCTVSDNGIGMSEEFQEHLFENFARENSATVSKQEGAGLGLSIVYRITKLANGDIKVTSTKGVGTTVVVELPLRLMDEKAIEEYKAEILKKEQFISEIDLKGKRVLIVEDNEMNREIAAEILEDNGLSVDMAEDGEVAVKLVVEKGVAYYDYILMDIQMPVMDGYEATDTIRHMPDGDRIPIIAVSANAFKEDKSRSLSAGMDAHVAKPIDVKVLLSTMYKLSSKKNS